MQAYNKIKKQKRPALEALDALIIIEEMHGD